MCGKVLCGVCATFSCLVIGIIVVLVVWVVNLKVPTAGVANVTWQKLEVTPTLAVDVEAKLWINNPNGWPLSGKVLNAKADVFSLDKNNASADKYFIGQASVDDTVNIATHHNTSFAVVLKQEITGPNAGPLILRLTADCIHIAGGAGTTKVGVNVTSAEVSFWTKHVTVDNLGIFFNATVPCPSLPVVAPGAANIHKQAEQSVKSEEQVIV